MFGANLGGWRTLGPHEALAAVPARAMTHPEGTNAADWIVPDFGGIPRVKKPPLAYWLIAATNRLTGRPDAFAARLPSAVSAILLCGLVGWWGARWYGRSAGLAAAVVQASSYWSLTYGRKAEVDVTLCLLTVAALALVTTAPPGVSGARWRWAGVWALAGIGWLGKFHFTPVLIFAPLIAHAVLMRRGSELKRLASPVGIAAFLALAVPWPALAALRVPAAADVWLVQTAGRAGGAFGVRSPLFYPLQALLMTVPWTPCWVWGTVLLVRRYRGGLRLGGDDGQGARLDRRLRRAWRRLTAGPPERVRRVHRDLFPVVWIAATVAVLSLSLGRNRHYLIPALPACSLLAGRTIAVSLTLARRGRLFGGRLRGVRATRLAWAAPTVEAAAFLALVCCGSSLTDRRAETAAFLRSLPTDEPILTVGLGESAALWHLPPSARRTEDAAGIAARLRRRGRAAVLADDRSAWLIDECAAAWRAAGGECTVQIVAREPADPGRTHSGFDPLRGLRCVLLNATPASAPVRLRTAAAGGIVAY